jgi:exodeoxyribonuclease VII large subunit
VGALQLKFEQLKQRLAAEGLFAAERKRPLPAYPQRIGLVTSPSGAAIRDVLHVIQRRHPGLEIILVPCRVQGEGAAAEIATAIRLLNEFSSGSGRREEALTEGRIENQSLLTSAATRLDLILITRGGGSLEDLWAFNEEAVARAIFESAIPVVSAVGHEIDFTIADFVADLRAATPSAAAEIITEGVFASRQFVAEAAAVMNFRVRQRLAREQEDFQSVTQRMLRAHPQRRLDELTQRLDELQSALLRSAKQGVRGQRVAWQNLATRLLRVRPGQLLKQRREGLHLAVRQLRELGRHQLANSRNHFATQAARLRLLGPEQVLTRGYSITMDAATGEILREAKRVKAGQRLRTRLKAGEIISRAGE